MSDPAVNDLGHEEGCQCPTCLPEAHPAPGASTALAPRADTYEWNGVRFYAFRGCPCCIAAALGRCLGYADDGGHLVEVIRQKWTKETEDGKVDMLDGKDFAILTGDDLREFKALLEDSDRRSLSSAARLMVLFEGGADMVGMKTDKPLGFELRKALKTSILPKLRRGETITAQDAAQVPLIAPAAPPPTPALAPVPKVASMTLDMAALAQAVAALLLPGQQAQLAAIQAVHGRLDVIDGRLREAALSRGLISAEQVAQVRAQGREIAWLRIQLGNVHKTDRPWESAGRAIINDIYRTLQMGNVVARVDMIPESCVAIAFARLERLKIEALSEMVTRGITPVPVPTRQNQRAAAAEALRKIGIIPSNVVPFRPAKSV